MHPIFVVEPVKPDTFTEASVPLAADIDPDVTIHDVMSVEYQDERPEFPQHVQELELTPSSLAAYDEEQMFLGGDIYQSVDMNKTLTKSPDDPASADYEFMASASTVDSSTRATPQGTYELSHPNRRNVLFLMADDMRPQLGAYLGEDYPTPYHQRKMHTPNFDRLANQSMLFRRAYVQLSLCGPSRTSILTSRRPDTTRVFGNNHYWRVVGGNFTTLPQYFKSHGYKTIGIGKVFHPSISSNNSDPPSWTEPFYFKYTDMHYHPTRLGAGWRAVEPEEREAIPLTDEFAVKHAFERLRDLAPMAKSGQQPFFMALGFRKPHVSLICPNEYHDLYAIETSGQYMSDIKWQSPHVRFHMEQSTTIGDENVIPEDVLRKLRKAYFACISYVDDLLGVLLDELESLGLMDNTVVSFIADHGYHLGENDHWGKYKSSEIANHVPMMIRVPGKTDRGLYTRSLVEAIDMYPTVVDAAGLPPVPSCPLDSSAVSVCTEGTSLMQIIDDPEKTLRKSAVSQVNHGTHGNQYSMRTDRYRYTVYARSVREEHPDGSYNMVYEWNRQGGSFELYDHQLDPEERFNRSQDPTYAPVIKDLQDMLERRLSPLYDIPET